MAFEQESIRTPTGIGRIIVELTTMPPDLQEAEFRLWVVFDDGTTRERFGDLVPHLEPHERQALMDFMATLRVRAEGQILP